MRVRSCIDDAESFEMQSRMSLISGKPALKNSISVSHSFKKSNNNLSVLKTEVCQKTNNQDTTQVKQQRVSSKYLFLANILGEMRTAIHQGIDGIIQVDLSKLASYINENLKGRGLDVKVYRIEIVDVRTNRAIRAVQVGSRRQGGALFHLEFNKNTHQAYKVYTTSLLGPTIRGMAGILVSTLLMLVILIAAFWYLIRTVMMLKSLEEMKADFVNNMTHELKTPIATAYAAVDTLLNFRQGEDRQKREKYLRISLDQLSHLSGLVGHILALASSKNTDLPLKKTRTDVAVLISQLVEQHQLRSDKQVVFVTHVYPSTLYAHVDAGHFENLLSNLIDNAIKYSYEVAKVEIRAAYSGRFVQIEVKDEGIGIAKENQPHLFDKFYRVPNGNLHNVKGYGLGLFYAKSVVDRHGGLIYVVSNPGKGSTFYIKIPIE